MTQERTTTRGLDPSLQLMAKLDKVMDEAGELKPATLDIVLSWLCRKWAPPMWAFQPTEDDAEKPA